MEFYPSKKAFSPVYLTSGPENRDTVFEFSLEWCSSVIHPAHAAHAARTSRTRFFFLRQLSHQCFCGEHQSGDRSGVLQRRADHLGRIDDTGHHQVLVFAGRHIEPFIAAALLDFLDDQSAFLAGVVSQLARRKLKCAANDLHTNGLIAFQFEGIECLLGAKVCNTPAGKDTLLNGCAGRMQGILHASLLLLHLGLGRGADIDYGDTTGELSQTLLQFFAIIVRSGFLDLTPDLVNPALDIFGRTFALNDRRVVFVDGDPLGLTKIVERDVFEFDAEVFGYTTTAGEHRDVLECRFAAVAEAGSFHCGNLKSSP